MKIRYFAINLESSTQRREHIENEAKNAGINLEIFKAITPDEINKIPHRYNASKTRRFYRRPLTPTEIACGLSHITLWRNLLKDSSADYYLILEDDVYIKSEMKKLIDSLDLSFIDFLRLNGSKKTPMKTISKLTGSYTLYRLAYGPMGARAYLINKKAAKHLIKYCEKFHAAIDTLMDRSYDHGIPIYAILPYPAQTGEYEKFGTDIGLINFKYTNDIKAIEKLFVRMQRFHGSLKKRYCTLLLRFQKN